MLIKKLLSGQLDNNLLLLLYVLCLAFFSYFLLQGIIEKPFSVSNLNYIILIAACIVYIIKLRKNAICLPHKNSVDTETKETIGIDKPIEKIALLVLSIICLVPVLAIFWIERNTLTASYTVEPEFEVFGLYISIGAGLLLIVSELENIIDISSKIIRQLLQLFGVLLTIATLVALIVYSSHIA